MANFELAFDYVLKNEGGLSTNPNDAGGITNHGISLRFLRHLETRSLRDYQIFDDPVDDETIKNLTIDQAADIYHGEFWSKARFGEIESQRVCNYLFDAAVNMGIAPAIKCVQRAIWSWYHNRHDFVSDGILGNETLHLINSASPEPLLAALRSERAGKYRVIAVSNANQEPNLDGWLNRAYKE